MSFIKKVPLPIVAVALSWATLGNLLSFISPAVKPICGCISVVMLVLFLLRLAMDWPAVKKELQTPIMLSVVGTFPMLLMLLATYVKPLWGLMPARAVWVLGLGLHVLLICTFSMKFLVKLDLKKVFASYYIVYVGIGVAGISAPAVEWKHLGVSLTWFAIVAFALVACLVTYRYLKVPEVPKPAQPLAAIYAAPASLCLAAYLNSVDAKALPVVIVLYICVLVFYLVGLFQTLPKLSWPFFPSFAAFTFPFAISGVATRGTFGFAKKAGVMTSWLPVLNYISYIAMGFAAGMVLYVTVRYLIFLCSAPPAQTPTQKPAA